MLIQEWLDLSTEERKTAEDRFCKTASQELWSDLFTDGVQRIKALLNGDGHQADQIANLLLALAPHSPDIDHQALSARMKAQVLLICFGQYDQAKKYYDVALDGYMQSHNDLERAKTENTHIWLLALNDQAEEAFKRGEWAMSTLARFEAWDDHTAACNNLAGVYHLLGYIHKAVETLEKINTSHLERVDSYNLIGIQGNRALFMQELGQYSGAIRLIEKTIDFAQAQDILNQSILGNLKFNLAQAHLKLGSYTMAQSALDDARTHWQHDGRHQDIVLGMLLSTECLLALRRFNDVLETFTALRALMAKYNVTPEKQFAFVNEAKAYMALKKPDDALNALNQAKEDIGSENPYVLLHFNLVGAEILHSQGRYKESLEIAQSVAEGFADQGIQLASATAYLLAAENCRALSQTTESHRLLDHASDIAQQNNLPVLRFHVEEVRGSLYQPTRPDLALQAYKQAITELERLQRHVMVEFRPNFMQDLRKQRLYEKTVSLLINQGEKVEAWRYIERAKSRALIELLGRKVNIRIQAETAEDKGLVNELNNLRLRRSELSQQVSDPEETDDKTAVLAEAQSVEKQITALWHKLLLRNAAYGRSAALNHIQADIELPSIENKTAIIEYFAMPDGHLSAAVLTNDPNTDQTIVEHIQLPQTIDQITALYRHLFLNIGLVARAPQANNPNVLRNMQGVLNRLYNALIRPLSHLLERHNRWRIVPHGILHYLPFEAFYDGQHYVVERTAISYLPSVSTATYSDPIPNTTGRLVVGHSYHGRIPQTQVEATQLAQLCQAELLQEEEVTNKALGIAMTEKQLIHIATHGEFRADNPLFSGLFLEDGWLTTLDIFDLELSASLVTLSACHTGRSVISGGDELLGIARAFLTAGASSLLLSQWAVDDQSTALLMGEFYQHLLAGKAKDIALQQAQLALMDGRLTPNQFSQTYQHPFFWSPFFLIGHHGPL